MRVAIGGSSPPVTGWYSDDGAEGAVEGRLVRKTRLQCHVGKSRGGICK